MLETELKRFTEETQRKLPFVRCTGRVLCKLCEAANLPARLEEALKADPESDHPETDICVSLDRTLKFAGSGRREINIALPAAEFLLAAGKSGKTTPKA